MKRNKEKKNCYINIGPETLYSSYNESMKHE